MSSCADGTGFNERDSKQVPAWLAERGLTLEAWLQWVAKLHAEVLPHGPACGESGCMLCCLTLFGLPVWCMQYGRYQDRVRRWIEEFNSQVLQPLNMFAATQTAVYDDGQEKSHYHEELSWLAVATTSEEIEELRKEVHVWRFNVHT
jgi:hypothetical protein